MDKPTLMFVDDEKHILNAMKWLFRKEYNLIFANSGEEAVDLLKTNRIDVLISDQKMPGMRGTEVLKAARDMCPKTIRLLLTGYSDYNAVISSINDGEVFRFIHKPWNNDKLKETIEEAVSIADAIKAEDEQPQVAVVREITIEDYQEPLPDVPGVLIIDPANRLVSEFEGGLPNSHPARFTSDLKSAIEILENHDIGVMIIEQDLKNPQITDFIKMMKKHHPEIVSLVVCDIEDVENVIDLINSGQVYRFLKSPIRPAMLKLAIESGLKHHKILKSRPQVRARHKVDSSQFDQVLSDNKDSLSEVKKGQEFSFFDLIKKIRNLK